MIKTSILIGDAGGSKTDWRLVSKQGIQQYTTAGFNAFTHPLEDFKADIKAKIVLDDIAQVYLYCAGVDTEGQKEKVSEGLFDVFEVFPIVESDLLGAARATCGVDPGYVGIIGTGSNASYYDGRNVVKVSESLGYILGDEGSGAYLAKQFLKGIFRDWFSENLRSKFQDRYHLTVDKAISSIYGATLPNQYLASFVPFIAEFKGDPEVYQLIYKSFRDFFKAYFRALIIDHPIHFVGSIAFHFSDILRQVATDMNYTITKIIASPIAGLVLFHQDEQ